MNHLIKLCITTGLGLLLSANLHAGSYKWTDKDGNVHYGSRPPAGSQYEKMKIDKAPRSSGQTAPKTPATETDKASQTIESEAAKNAEIRKQNCKAAKNNLKLYQVHRYIKGADGKVRKLSDSEREAKIKTAEGHIRQFCD